ncbi:Xaa-Pro dipeptidase [Actinobacillus suis]|uniref:Xaa-Pro dipeptidase n=2 Tax=Actinobacillus suis TaxID=716 RepID=K0G5V5_ACTSU|nr:Xaa-Pro dipeptidase [Actinobacillus suis]AFU19483.1 proline dipeptidase [Actinobacillus suis H91-0380]AIJ31621.1 proline dipeptidase [Actinobacillus suis ATCC 33415]MCO4166414.1 Xaa-Pro dipeptidase [Actinobacillus suis]MCO4168711.1 Xaa-Pro dipeptidase [Actinobacillus suis]MCQ9630869.1 Xaa-Pro dipeptidase [Actinobacillus suis]
MKQLFTQHIKRLQQVVQTILESNFLSGLWIHSGTARYHFLDDQTAPFKINPHFNYFFPCPTAENCWLFLDGKNKPTVYFYAPNDYWHTPPTAPTDAFFADEFQWVILQDAQEIAKFIQNPTACAFIGENENLANSLGFNQINPQKVLNQLHFERSIKSEFEIEAIYQAQFAALKGHQAAKQAFFEGKSEFEINLAYLKASQQSDLNVPYGNIIAINQHSAILHYTRLDYAPNPQPQSFLIDAGATVHGYASDITRTYAADPNSEFAAMIKQMEQYKYRIIERLAVDVNYLSYHTQMQQWIAEMLHQYDFVRLTPEQIFEEGISRAFLPHGLGHLLGLQVHDVAGFQQNHRGTRKSPPEVYPSLRCTRDLAENMVLTIEPGFYFIDMLLNPLQNSPLARHINWQKIAEFKQFGGIRTEDNIVMRSQGAENLTQKAEIELQLSDH